MRGHDQPVLRLSDASQGCAEQRTAFKIKVSTGLLLPELKDPSLAFARRKVAQILEGQRESIRGRMNVLHRAAVERVVSGAPDFVTPDNFCEAALQHCNTEGTLHLKGNRFVIEGRDSRAAGFQKPELLLHQRKGYGHGLRAPGDRP